MKNVILIIIFLTFSCCQQKVKGDESLALKNKNSNEIVKTIISQDSLSMRKNKAGSSSLCMDLIKINIYIPEKLENQNLPPSFNGISINQLLKAKVKKRFINGKWIIVDENKTWIS